MNMFGTEPSTKDTVMYLVMKWIDHLISMAYGKHEQSLYNDDVEITVMHPTLSSNRLIVGSMIAGQWPMIICVTHTVSCLYL